MAKVIHEFGVATCLAVKPESEEKALDWSNWRLNYIGREGWLNLCESGKKYPGSQFLYFFGGEESEKDWYLKTSYGQVELEGKTLTFTTDNSCYVFQLHLESEG